MKSLTGEWACGLLPDKAARAARNAYYAHLRLLAETATGQVSELARCKDPKLDLSDGLVDSIAVDRSNGLVRIRLVQGSLQQGTSESPSDPVRFTDLNGVRKRRIVPSSGPR